MSGQSDFYDYIKKLSDRRSRKRYLETSASELLDAILAKHRDIIMRAAETGYKKAILFTYRKDALFRGRFSVHDMLDPDESLKSDFKHFGIPLVLESVRAALHPFQVEVVPQSSDIMLIVASWD